MASLAGAPRVFDQLRNQGTDVVRRFDARPGLTGWVLRNRAGEHFIVYSLPDGKTVIEGGSVIDDSGVNLSVQFADKFIPKPDFDAVWATLDQHATVTTGATGANVKSVIYVFLDPNCVFCNLAWRAFKAYEASGLQVRWLPVGLLGEDALKRAAAILEAPNPSAALNQHEASYKPGDRESGIKPVDAPRPDTVKKLQANIDLMRRVQVRGTPATIYRDPQTKRVVVREGMPPLAMIPAITGLPAVEIDDPMLARFK